MTINDAKPEEWDKLRKPECELIKPEDPVEKPAHYRVGEVEAIDYINQQLGGEGIRHYLEGNILKYMHRWRFKNGVEDLRKARWYLDKLIYEEVQGGMDG
jgi:hypothetical protein